MNGTIECAFVGTAVTGAELKTSAGGKPWAAFLVAIGTGDDAQFVRVSIFGETAERIAAAIDKGSKLYAEGNFRLSQWTDKDGKERSGLSVAAWKCELLGRIGRNRPRRPSASSADPIEDAKRRSQAPLDPAF